MIILSKIEKEIKSAKDKRKELIVSAFDGRTQRYISEKTGIEETKISKWINGAGEISDEEISLIEKMLGVEFK